MPPAACPAWRDAINPDQCRAYAGADMAEWFFAMPAHKCLGECSKDAFSRCALKLRNIVCDACFAVAPPWLYQNPSGCGERLEGKRQQCQYVGKIY